MDRPIANTVKHKRKIKLTLRIITAFVIFLAVIIIIRLLVRPSVHKDEFRTAITEVGNIEASVTASGTIMPEFEETMISPIQSSIIKIFHNTGDEVLEGDTILMLDTKSTKASLDKMIDELNLKKNSIDQLKLQYESNLIDLKTEYEIKKLHVDNMEAALKEEEYLNKIGGGTKESVEKAGLNLQIARLELEQIEQSIDNQERMMKADLTELNYEINIQELNVIELQDKLRQSTLTSDKKGVITWINDQIGKNISIGEELVKIADLESYEVDGSISDMHAEKLNIGGQVIVRLNDNNEIRGEIISISPAISGNIIQFKIKLDNKNHPLLRPNLKADVFVITSFKENVLRLANGAYYKGGIRQMVFTLKDKKLIRKEVEFGESNFDYVEIVNGLSQNEEVIVSDMSDYERHQEIRIKN